MKIKAKQVQILVIVLAGTLILFGSLNALFHLVPDSDLAGKISDGIFFTGIAAYFWSWKLRKQEAAETKESDDADAAGEPDAKAIDDKAD
jgi:hypothetical protein